MPRCDTQSDLMPVKFPGLPAKGVIPVYKRRDVSCNGLDSFRSI